MASSVVQLGVREDDAELVVEPVKEPLELCGLTHVIRRCPVRIVESQ